MAVCELPVDLIRIDAIARRRRLSDGARIDRGWCQGNSGAGNRCRDLAATEADPGYHVVGAEVLERIRCDAGELAGKQVGVVGGLAKRDHARGVRQRRLSH